MQPILGKRSTFSNDRLYPCGTNLIPISDRNSLFKGSEACKPNYEKVAEILGLLDILFKEQVDKFGATEIATLDLVINRLKDHLIDKNQLTLQENENLDNVLNHLMYDSIDDLIYHSHARLGFGILKTIWNPVQLA